MNRAIVAVVLGALLGGSAVWFEVKHAPTEAAPEEADTITLSHDAEGNVVVGMSDEMQGEEGILVANPAAAEFAPELRRFGKVIDAAPLAELLAELTSAQAAFAASSDELARLKLLESQGNASPRSRQAAETAAHRDQLALQSAQDRLALNWGKALATRNDLPSFVRSLVSHDAAIIQFALAPSDSLHSAPAGVRIQSVVGAAVNAEFLGEAGRVDSQNQARAFWFLARATNSPWLPGEAVTGDIALEGTPLAGVVLPKSAIVRTEGKGWFYVLNAGGESLTRKEIPLDHPTETGWFLNQGVTVGDLVVVTGAQTLLAAEQKAVIQVD